MKQSIAAVACLAISLSAASAQSPVEAPEFEVASVKPAVPPPGGYPPAMMMLMSGPMAEMVGFSGGPGTKDPGRMITSG